ncbi:MAG: tRNA lysidine(34) synthetase TilS [Pseudobdellovibrionaceae bacterium]|nr:tRNA lysidine(34) synthetase TilS [Pseudobdellovibrionaceae bacterium]
MSRKILTASDFKQKMADLGLPEPDNSPVPSIAIAVSGGADSMALAYMMRKWAGNDSSLHILTVDHDLRKESADEIKMVERFAKLIGVKCKKFKWIGEKSDKSIQENARAARYEMMAQYCRKNKIKYLAVAHHADDQFETFLFRLAKGSGPDGLACMRKVQLYDDHLTLLRPLLDFTHEELIDFCRSERITWAEDPSNTSDKYMRGRMRGSKEVLEREGLSSKRISSLVDRLQRNKEMVDALIGEKADLLTIVNGADRIDLRWPDLSECHEEVIVRIIQKIISGLRPEKDFPARLEDIERLAGRIKEGDPFKGATLGGVIFRPRKKDGILQCLRESGK